MKRFYKNTINFQLTPDPLERRYNIDKEIVRHADYMPNTLKYEDIDNAFKKWVENCVIINNEGYSLPTMVLYSNQRFSEYSQSWKYTDENNNIRLNFKTVSRDNNPSHGTIVGDTYNIPGERFYTFHSLQAIDDSGKKYRIDYKMKQPTAVDLHYKVSILTNKYVLINEFNETIHQIFNAKQNYISPNGHYMSIVLDNISDDSEYNIDDRQFFSQTANLIVRGYIIKQEDLKVEERPISSIICFEGGEGKRKKPTIELSEYDPCDIGNGYYKKPIDIDIDLSYCYPCNGKIKFTIDEDFTLTDLQLKENNNLVENEIELYVNDVFITNNLLEDAYESYKKLNYIPNDSTDENTTEYTERPVYYDNYYKYIKYNNDYYVWHKIRFKYGDDITIKTKRVKRHINSTGLVLIGYNRLVGLNEYQKNHETLFDMQNEKENDNIIIVDPQEECKPKI